MKIYIVKALDDANIYNALYPVMMEGSITEIKEVKGCRDCRHCITDIYTDGYCAVKPIRIDIYYININECSWFKAKEYNEK